MGNIPFCNYYEKNKQIVIKSDLNIKGIENHLNINQKDTNNNNIYMNEKFEFDINQSTLSPQNKLINPLPEIVIIKYKKL